MDLGYREDLSFLVLVTQRMDLRIEYHAFFGLFVCLFGAFIGAIREIEVRTCYWVLDKIYIFIYGM